MNQKIKVSNRDQVIDFQIIETQGELVHITTPTILDFYQGEPVEMEFEETGARAKGTIFRCFRSIKQKKTDLFVYVPIATNLIKTTEDRRSFFRYATKDQMALVNGLTANVINVSYGGCRLMLSDTNMFSVCMDARVEFKEIAIESIGKVVSTERKDERIFLDVQFTDMDYSSFESLKMFILDKQTEQIDECFKEQKVKENE